MLHRYLRSLNRLALAGILVLTVLLTGVVPAEADSWCEADPIVLLNGKTRVQVLVAIPTTYERLVDNPTRVEIKTPQQISRQLVFVDSGFNGKGEDFSFSDIGDGNLTSTQYRVWVKVTVPIATSQTVPTRVTINVSNQPTQVYYGNHKGSELSFWINR